MMNSWKDAVILSAVVDIAIRSKGRPVSQHDLSARHDLATRYLEPMLQTLARAGILKGVRGPRGGYRLGRDAQRITVMDILVAVNPIEGGRVPAVATPFDSVISPIFQRATCAFMDALQGVTVDHLVRSAGASS